MKSILLPFGIKICALSLGIFLYNALASAQVPGKNNRENIGEDVMAEEVPTLHEPNNVRIYQVNGKYGFQLNNQKKPELYDKISSSYYQYIVKLNGKFGLTDRKGELLVKPEYDSIYMLPYQMSTHILVQNGKLGAVDEVGKIILKPNYKQIHFCSSKFPFAILGSPENGLELIKIDEKPTTPIPLEHIQVYANLSIIKSQGKFGIIHDKIIIPIEYDSIFHPVNSLYDRGNSKNIKLPPFDYRNQERTIECLAIRKNGKLGMVDMKGELIFPVEFDDIRNNSTFGYYSILKGKLFGLYFVQTGVKTDIEYQYHYKDGIGYVMAVKNDKTGVYNMKGTLILPFEYDKDFIAQYSGLGLRVTKNKKRGLVDPKGNILVPPLYDDIATFDDYTFKGLIRVISGGKSGVVNLRGDTIIPVQFEWISDYHGMFKVITPNPDRKCGLLDTMGQTLVPIEYNWIRDTDAEVSKLAILIKNDQDYGFYHLKSLEVLDVQATEFGYIHDEDLLKNPENSSASNLIKIRNKEGKIGLLNEMSGKLDVPAIYQNIYQQFTLNRLTYYAANRQGKHGIIDADNREILPFVYDSVQFDLLSDYLQETTKMPLGVVVKKNKKYGVVDMNNHIIIPIEYTWVQRISYTGLYKVKSGSAFKIMNVYGRVIHPGPFDEVGQFEVQRASNYDEESRFSALTFHAGKMRVINDSGRFISAPIPMQPHVGYRSFDELKSALVKALDAEDDVLLREFANEIAPSPHLLYYLKQNIFTEENLGYMNVAEIRERYFDDLKDFKESSWKSEDFGKTHRYSLVGVEDYTMYGEDYVTNWRTTDHAYNDRLLELILRHSVKVNGFWISSYFMTRRFGD